jgi:ribosome-associated heat shock protein Hsp15
MTSDDQNKVRLDKWLWAARFFRTRNIAIDAINGGKVHVNGHRSKPAKAVNIGDEIIISKGAFKHTVIILALSDKRGPASIAQTLYEESLQSIENRKAIADNLSLQRVPGSSPIRGRPTKKSRRQIVRFTRQD